MATKTKILIGFFKTGDGWKNHTVIFHKVDGVQKTFGCYQDAEKFINSNNLGQSASPVEVHEE